MSEELEVYKKAIANLFDSGSDLPVSNSKPDHAVALYELFFDRAREEVIIFCNKLKKEVFNNEAVTKSLECALDRGIKIRVLLQCDSAQVECTRLSNFQTHDNFLPKYASTEDANSRLNFCVVDKKAFRYESDKNTFEAVAVMNNPKVSEKLYKSFEEMWGRVDSVN